MTTTFNLNKYRKPLHLFRADNIFLRTPGSYQSTLNKRSLPRKKTLFILGIAQITPPTRKSHAIGPGSDKKYSLDVTSLFMLPVMHFAPSLSGDYRSNFLFITMLHRPPNIMRSTTTKKYSFCSYLFFVLILDSPLSNQHKTRFQMMVPLPSLPKV